MGIEAGISQKLIDLLACPECSGTLTGKTEISCTKCKTSFPHLDNTPWLFLHGTSVRDQWRSKCRALITLLNQRSDNLQGQLRQQGLLSNTKTRLEKLSSACLHNAKEFAQLLSELFGDELEQWQDLPSATLRNKVPTQQGPRTYLDLLFRDWAWGNDENKIALETVQSLIPKDQTWQHLFVLGSGAGRLSSDLSQNFPGCQIVGVDINPLLVMTAKRMIQGGQLELYDFPLSPDSLNHSAIKRTLSGPNQAPDNLQFLYADALDLPVKKHSLQAVLTPWLIDVIPQDLAEFSRRVNTALKAGGDWINFGPLGFSQGSESQHYTPEEVQELLEESSFDLVTWKEESIPYLQAPGSGHWRQEKVWGFHARKVKNCKEPKRYHYLPDWLENHEQAIPQEEFLAAISAQSRFQFEVLTAVDGQRSLDQIATMMTTHYGMDLEMAKDALLSFFIRAYEESLQPIP